MSSMSCPMRLVLSRTTLSSRLPSSSSLSAVVFQQDVREAVDGAQRRAQVVRNRIGKRLQFLVGRFQLRRALGDALFQFLIELADFFFRLLRSMRVRSTMMPKAISPASSSSSRISSGVKALGMAA